MELENKIHSINSQGKKNFKDNITETGITKFIDFIDLQINQNTTFLSRPIEI